MLFSDQLAFLHLQKTGGNHVAKLLGRYMELTKVGKHNGLVEGLERPYVLLGVRNPWDWYVSLWAYGCQDEGSFHQYPTDGALQNVVRSVGRYAKTPSDWPLLRHQLKHAAGNKSAFWRDLYSDPDDASRFRNWLKAIHELPTRNNIGDEFPALPLSNFCGVMTARYLRVSSLVSSWEAQRIVLKTPQDVARYIENSLVATHFVRTEFLEEDVFAILKELGHPIESADSLKTKRVNSSRRRGASYYYDQESVDLVYDRDRIVIERHGYNFDDLAD